MPKSKHPDHDREHEHRHEHERHQHGDREEGGDDPRAHSNIIERRWLGSPPPSPERYALAVQQWQALPGAVARPATDVTTTPTSPNPDGEEKKS
jgi:hypothetical protein